MYAYQKVYKLHLLGKQSGEVMTKKSWQDFWSHAIPQTSLYQ